MATKNLNQLNERQAIIDALEIIEESEKVLAVKEYNGDLLEIGDYFDVADSLVEPANKDIVLGKMTEKFSGDKILEYIKNNKTLDEKLVVQTILKFENELKLKALDELSSSLEDANVIEIKKSIDEEKNNESEREIKITHIADDWALEMSDLERSELEIEETLHIKVKEEKNGEPGKSEPANDHKSKKTRKSKSPKKIVETEKEINIVHTMDDWDLEMSDLERSELEIEETLHIKVKEEKTDKSGKQNPDKPSASKDDKIKITKGLAEKLGEENVKMINHLTKFYDLQMAKLDASKCTDEMRAVISEKMLGLTELLTKVYKITKSRQSNDNKSKKLQELLQGIDVDSFIEKLNAEIALTQTQLIKKGKDIAETVRDDVKGEIADIEENDISGQETSTEAREASATAAAVSQMPKKDSEPLDLFMEGEIGDILDMEEKPGIFKRMKNFIVKTAKKIKNFFVPNDDVLYLDASEAFVDEPDPLFDEPDPLLDEPDPLLDDPDQLLDEADRLGIDFADLEEMAKEEDRKERKMRVDKIKQKVLGIGTGIMKKVKEIIVGSTDKDRMYEPNPAYVGGMIVRLGNSFGDRDSVNRYNELSSEVMDIGKGERRGIRSLISDRDDADIGGR